MSESCPNCGESRWQRGPRRVRGLESFRPDHGVNTHPYIDLPEGGVSVSDGWLEDWEEYDRDEYEEVLSAEGFIVRGPEVWKCWTCGHQWVEEWQRTPEEIMEDLEIEEVEA